MGNYPDTTWEADPRAPWNQDPYLDDVSECEDDQLLELTPVEKLAVAQAFYNAVGKMVSTKDEGNLRGQVNAYFEEVFNTTGAKSFDVKLLGEKVGTYSITVSKAKPAETVRTLSVMDMESFDRWADENGYTYVGYDMESVQRMFEETGEVPPGCRVDVEITPGVEGGKVSRTTLKVDADAVIDAIGPKLQSASELLLEEGMDQ